MIGLFSLMEAYEGTAGLIFETGSAFVSSWSRYVFSSVAILLVAILYICILVCLSIWKTFTRCCQSGKGEDGLKFR
jgi:hypothetical protein